MISPAGHGPGLTGAPHEVVDLLERIEILDSEDVIETSANSATTQPEDLACLHSQFIAQWKSPPCLDSPLQIGYISGTNVSRAEAIEEGLELSKILGHPVMGIYNHSICVCCQKHPELDALTTIWSRFFHSHPKGLFIQYCYGNGIRLVETALTRCSHPYQIMIVGINPARTLDHPLAYYFRATMNFDSWCCTAKSSVVTLPINEHAHRLFRVQFNDPTFIVALRYPYTMACKSSGISPNRNSITVHHDIALLLGVDDPHHELVEIDKQTNEILFTKAYILSECYKSMMSSPETWDMTKLDRVMSLAAICIRLIDYAVSIGSHYRIYKKEKNNTTSSPSSSNTMSQIVPILSMSALVVLWMTYGIAITVLVFTGKHISARKTRIGALACISMAWMLYAVDLMFHTKLSIIHPHDEANSAVHRVFIAYSVLDLLNVSINAITPKIRGFFQKLAILASHREARQHLQTKVTVISKSFHQALSNARILLALLLLIIWGGLFQLRHVFRQPSSNATSSGFETCQTIHTIFTSTMIIFFIALLFRFNRHS